MPKANAFAELASNESVKRADVAYDSDGNETDKIWVEDEDGYGDEYDEYDEYDGQEFGDEDDEPDEDEE